VVFGLASWIPLIYVSVMRDDWTLLKKDRGSNLYRKLDIATIEGNIVKSLLHIGAEKCSIFKDDTIGSAGPMSRLAGLASLEKPCENPRAQWRSEPRPENRV
jgi:hypothetical protein